MSKYLQQANELSSKAIALTQAQKDMIAQLMAKAAKAKTSLELALESIARDEKNKVLSSIQARKERAICSAEVEEQIESIHAKIREINPVFTSNAGEIVQDVMITGGVKSLELIGQAAGFLGRIISTSKAKYDEVVKEGHFESPKKVSTLEALEQAGK